MGPQKDAQNSFYLFGGCNTVHNHEMPNITIW